ncbi:MAG TPA: leucyl/phenylalanyl-tRNA--protein transferase [Candidatus Hydrogenedentes bacterium]|nr:leucyl/phenylalanyl-tRNA--protein transferase [Candidatus Hydrogenedentota bacterium]
MPIYFLDDDSLTFPPATHTHNGLLAVGGDLSPGRLLAAYQKGIFPWYSDGEPILWWSPDVRMVLFPENFHLSRSLRRFCRATPFSFRMDTAFRQTISYCAGAERSGENGTWIHPEMIEAYCTLHEMGFAHSVECYRNGSLVGGLYGINLGSAFFGESMFSLEKNASKFALAVLSAQCRLWGFKFIDCQMYTPHLASLGAVEMTKAKFLKILKEALKEKNRKGKWIADEQIILQEILNP